MPINNNLPDHKLLVNLKTREEANPKFVDALSAVDVEILNAPALEDLKRYIPEFSSGTWEDYPKKNFTEEERAKVIEDLFAGYILPTAFETIKITFLIKGMDLVDVCHLIRHRTMGFSASGTGDRDCRHDNVLLKPSIIGSKYEDDIVYHIKELMKIYGKMYDDPDIPVLDPRTILPRNTSNYYYVTADLKAIMNFVSQRKDESIEPETMNVIALKLWIEICKLYPSLKNKFDFNGTDRFAVETSKGGRSSNFYVPEPKNDVYEYKLSWFMKQKMRREMRNGEQYLVLKEVLLKELESIS